MRFCIYCGMPMEEDDLFCTRCGKPAAENPAEQAEAPGGDGFWESADGTAASGSDTFDKFDAFGTFDECEEPSETYDESGGREEVPFSVHEREELGLNRVYIIACAVIVAVILCVSVLMLVRPFGKKDSQSEEDQTVVYEEENGTGGQNLQQGAVTPSAGEYGDPAPAEEKAQDPPSAPADPGAPAAENESRSENVGNAAESGDPTGWVVDEDGNEVYYPAQDEAYTDNDQTGTGADGTDASGALHVQEESGQQAGQSPQAEDGQEQDALQGYAAAGTDDSYLLPESGSRYYSRRELEGLDDWTLQMAINEIYARHGRKFDTPEIRQFFEARSWYRGTIDPAVFDGNESAYFNQYEMGNRELMAQIRAEHEAARAGTGTGTRAGTGTGR